MGVNWNLLACLETTVCGNYIIGTQGRWTPYWTHNGDGHTMQPGTSTAATTAPDGAIYSITAEGEIHWINGSNGSTRQVITNGNLFKGARGIVWYKGYLYAIGKNTRFYVGSTQILEKQQFKALQRTGKSLGKWLPSVESQISSRKKCSTEQLIL